MKKANILIGINWQSNASASLMVNGKILGAVSEERFSRVKNDERYPKKAIDWLLSEYKIKSSEIDAVCYISTIWTPSYNLIRRYTKFKIKDFIKEQNLYWKKRIYGNKKISLIKIFRDKLDLDQYPGKKYWKNIYKKLSEQGDHTDNKKLESLGKKIRSQVINKHLNIDEKKIFFIDHSSGHAAWAYYSCKNKDKKKYLVLTLDAFGDFINFSINKFLDEKKIKRFATGKNSIIARLYRYITLILGFKPDEHEYKLMGMAPYAKKEHYHELYEKFKKFQDVRGIKFLNKKMPKDLYFDIKDKLEGYRFDSVCGALQKFTEYLTEKWVLNLSRKFKTKNFMLAGGVAMNVKNNLNLTNIKGIKNLYVPFAPDDSTLSMGSVYYYNSIILKKKNFPVKNAYLGPTVTLDKNQIKSLKNVTIKKNNINKHASNLLIEGKIIGRVVDRAEFGARALGNRSILSHPSRIDCVRKINDTIKNRDFWMPFAATVLQSKAKSYFKIKDNIKNYEYMTKCLETTNLGKKYFSAAIHPHDKTCRPQILQKNSNPEFEDLIYEFGKKSNIYGVLNTSFNRHGFPIINNSKEAINIFRESKLDALILQNCLIIKSKNF